MTVRYAVTLDEDYQPWGDDGIKELETKKINSGEWEPYILWAYIPCEHEHGPDCPHTVDWETIGGCVDDADLTGVYDTLDALPREFLREYAQDMTRTLIDNNRAAA
ncbi:hypothetical protein [Actinomadura atramentaria]|uniref:hypothetical protein n=1 Tax=Actinomadura atramentaria TaxID=1990 RepID=UPI00037D2360|nr:hypothetical protein [Actinomadura atramentaria]